MTDIEKPRLWRDSAFVDDEWTLWPDDDQDGSTAQPEPGAPVIIPLACFESDPNRFTGHDGPLGLQLPAGADIGPVLPFLHQLKLIALEFPSFADGRNYSTARLLRERHWYDGELRAVGDILADQIPLMHRCGIDAFQITNPPTMDALASGKLATMKRFYQPVGTSDTQAGGTRPWARRPV